LCEEHDALYIADEVQVGLMRTGELWGITGHGIEPDILVTAKGLSGGVYPIAAVLLSERSGAWLREDGFGHISTFGGAELGCLAALTTLQITLRPEVRESVHRIARAVGAGLGAIRDEHPGWFTGIRQSGVVLGLEFGHPEGAKHVMRELYETGVWAIFSTLDPRVLQFKPGLLMTPELVDELLGRVADGIARAARRAAADAGAGR
jgi:acetylornithine/succinyldiaminopimelate/putrescine aminotransferase